MYYFFVSLLYLFVIFAPIYYHLLFFNMGKAANGITGKLSPDKTRWPTMGESLQFRSSGWKGRPEKFIFDGMSKYSNHVFSTHLLGEKAVVLCGANGNKFLFSNENKLVEVWWPNSVNKVFPSSIQTASKQEAIKMKNLLLNFLKPEVLQSYVGIMDGMVQRHFATRWENRSEVYVFPLTKRFTFLLACRLFIRVKDPNQVEKFAGAFNVLASGIISVTIDLPGTPFNKDVKASNVIRKELLSIIKRRRMDLGAGKASPRQIWGSKRTKIPLLKGTLKKSE